ncbi:MAG: sugar transferase [Planctomycetota bacterium]
MSVGPLPARSPVDVQPLHAAPSVAPGVPGVAGADPGLGLTPADQPAPVAPTLPQPTLWGHDPSALHERFWAARSVQVVRAGQPVELATAADLFLLVDAACLTIFRLGQLADTLAWLRPKALVVRLHSLSEGGYREQVVADDADRFVRFSRDYSSTNWRLGRVALTGSKDIAQAWQSAADGRVAWRALRKRVDPAQRSTLGTEGRVFDRTDPRQAAEFVDALVRIWRKPDSTISRAKKFEGEVYRDAQTHGRPPTRFVGPVWIGAGRDLRDIDAVVGPAVLWDDPEAKPSVEPIAWRAPDGGDLTAPPTPDVAKVKRLTTLQRATKRAFDIVAATLLLTLALPVFPLVMLAIWIEDRGPFFFAHRRESMGGVEFPCLKFRTMKQNAEQLKAELMAANQADGPQFFIEDDPRHTRVGRFLRKFNLDELPQLLNVLAGHMSIVGPRPSPHKENQFCPPWREARLSVRPGITGLWQVKRSRDHGKDFQEWIRYDIQYVENLSWGMDFKILWLTFLMMTKLGKLFGK